MNRGVGEVMMRIPLCASALFTVLALSGCRARDATDFIPPTGVARSAVEQALDAWRDNLPRIKDVTDGDETLVSVELVDNHRQPAQSLESFEIVGETSATNARAFVVKLSLDNPREELKVRYLVVGIDPLWVFRQEDYDMLTHWDHPMPKEGESSSDGAVAPGTSATGAESSSPAP